MRQQPITREKIDELLQFLPLLDHPGPETRPKGMEMEQDPVSGDYIMPVPEYPRDVSEFFRLAGQDCWRDPEYLSSNAGEMLASDEAIATASMVEIKTMLTFCVRGERFCDGHWDGLIQGGQVGALLRRLQVLRGSVET